MTNRDDRGGSLTRRPEGTLSRQDGNRFLFGNPWREMDEMQRRMDALFSRVFGMGLPDMGWGRRNWEGDQQSVEPDVDVFENNDEYVIHAALPGINPEDIQVQATNTSIMVTARSRSPFEAQEGQGDQSTQNQQFQNQQSSGATSAQMSSNQAGSQSTNQPYTQHRQSRYSRQSWFEFGYTLPEEIKPNEVKANVRNGRLELRLPKADNAPSRIRPVSIPVQGETQNATLPGGATAQGTGTSGTTGTMSGQEHQRRNDQTTPQTGQVQPSQPVTSSTDKSGQS